MTEQSITTTSWTTQVSARSLHLTGNRGWPCSGAELWVLDKVQRPTALVGCQPAEPRVFQSNALLEQRLHLTMAVTVTPTTLGLMAAGVQGCAHYTFPFLLLACLPAGLVAHLGSAWSRQIKHCCGRMAATFCRQALQNCVKSPMFSCAICSCKAKNRWEVCPLRLGLRHVHQCFHAVEH